jgi:hypothetical protein
MNHLKRQALLACKARGHIMYSWHHYNWENAVSRCVNCGKEVQILGNPKPNEINIAGEAVAINCKD